MRETWVPLFQDILQSSLWAHDSDTRVVWVTLMALADPEGYVPAAAPGIALAANVALDKTRAALAVFEAPDPDSRTEDHDGRRIEKVPRGWRILNYAAHLERARREAEKARKRRWARANRAAANDTNRVDWADEDQAEYLDGFKDGVDAVSTPRSDDVAARSETVDASKSKSKSKSKSGDPDPETAPPVGAPAEQFMPALAEALGTTMPVMFHTLDGWEPTHELRAEAQLAGVTDFDERVAAARLITIGGPGGVRDRTQWVRAQLPRWRRWRETDAAKASTVRHPSGGMPEPAGARATGWGKHVPFPAQAFCSKHGLDPSAEVRAFLATGQADTVTHEAADKAFQKWLVARAKERRGKPAA